MARGLDYRTGLVAGVSAGDLDGDGDFDLVIVSGTRRRVIALVNDGAGRFNERVFLTIPDALWSYQTGAEPTIGLSGSDSTALGDLDGDGDLDLVVGNYWECVVFWCFGRNRLYLNNGTGTFTPAPASQMPVHDDPTTSVALGDVDGDGDLDLVIGNQIYAQMRLY